MRRLIIAVALAAFVLPASAAAAAGIPGHLPVLGFGEQRAEVFHNKHWKRLGVRHMHYLVPWDVLSFRWQRDEVDRWMHAATVAGVRPLVAFGVSRMESRKKIAPTVRQYRKRFRRFHKRYPQVSDFVVWNEANHCSQPVCHRPERVARYYDAMVEECRSCTIVAADVLDSDSMEWWIRGFKRAVRHRAALWGLHNYVDANRLQTRRTRRLLHLVRGRVWFTETGGLVARHTTSPIEFPQGVRHAGRVTHHVLHKLAAVSPRIKRIYLYHFQHHGAKESWDSGLLSPHGKPRPSYKVAARWMVRAEEARRARRAAQRR